MINTTKSNLVFLKTGEELHPIIVESIQEASKWILDAYDMPLLDLKKVTTRMHSELAFPAHVAQFILHDLSEIFDEKYIKDVFEFVSIDRGECTRELYAAVTKNSLASGYRRTYLYPLRRGLSVFLVVLHIRRVIVLPYSFHWPHGLDLGYKGKILGRRELCPLDALPELLRFIRAVNCREGAKQSEPVFENYTSKQRERLVWMGQRLIVSAGWLELADVNYKDMIGLKVANDETGFSGHPDLALLMLANLFEIKYGAASPVTAAGWRNALSDSKSKRELKGLEGALSRDHVSLVELAAALSPTAMAPDALVGMTSLPGIDFDLTHKAQTWIGIEQTFLRKVRRESKKQCLLALGYFNIYLFGYLPYWYSENQKFEFEYPSSPEKLISGIFVSDLGLLEGRNRPLAFVEFLDSTAQVREWVPSFHYSLLKQVEKLFEFIERHSTSLPKSIGFRQPIYTHDYPVQRKSTGTNKRPIPRRVFKLFLAYLEMLAALSQILLERVTNGEVTADMLAGFDSSRTTIDCVEKQEIFGFSPMVFHQGKAYRIDRIPNIFNAEFRKLKDRGILKVPHPHALHQIIVSLYTGLRHNHIQWLDSETFDKDVDDTLGREFAELFVNTDKAKNKAWTPHVNFRVIEILRQQLAWRMLIDVPGFAIRVHYNNNKESKWGSFRPLFSYYSDGRPHSDAMYTTCWARLLGGLQSLLGTVGERSIKLFRFLPPNVQYDDPDIDEKLRDYGAKQTRRCILGVKSDITPHSARVSVVSQAIGILSADLIGRYWTGQTEATVYHYVVPDEEEIHAEQQRQNLALRQIGLDSGYEAMLRASPGRSPHIKADGVDSNLSTSLKANFDEAISSYGCISLSFLEREKTGLDVLMETRAAGAVENKTEICPYGNQCPPEVVSSLKGWRRCGPCHFAVRSIDHLPAITAKIRQVLEGLSEVESRIANVELGYKLTSEEVDSLENTRDVLAEDLVSWQMAAEVLEAMRQQIAAGESTKSWHVRKPEIIEKHLRRALFPNNTTAYLLARLKESEAFPALESPQIRARFDLLRRRLLANAGNIREAFSLEQSANPAAECLGLLRSIMSAQNLTLDDISDMLESDASQMQTSVRQLASIRDVL